MAYAAETNASYPADGTGRGAGGSLDVPSKSGVVRQDVTTSFAGVEGTAGGIPLHLDLTIIVADGGTPMAGAAVYIRHCAAAGDGSL